MCLFTSDMMPCERCPITRTLSPNALSDVWTCTLWHEKWTHGYVLFGFECCTTISWLLIHLLLPNFRKELRTQNHFCPSFQTRKICVRSQQLLDWSSLATLAEFVRCLLTHEASILSPVLSFPLSYYYDRVLTILASLQAPTIVPCASGKCLQGVV